MCGLSGAALACCTPVATGLVPPTTGAATSLPTELFTGLVDGHEIPVGYTEEGSSHGSEEEEDDDRKPPPGGGGGGGGGDGGGDPGGFGDGVPFQRQNGPVPRPAVSTDMSWSASTEDRVYRYKDIAQVTIPNLLNNASEAEAWNNQICLSLGACDQSKDGYILKWVGLPMDPLGSPVDVLNRFHLDSQGFHRLDRWLGAQLCSASNQQHHLFGLQIKTYVSHCRHHSILPKGRVIVAMVMLRFRLDRQRGGTTYSYGPIELATSFL